MWLHAVLATALGALAGAYFAVTAVGFASWGSDAFFQLLGAGAPLLAGISCGLAADAEQRAGDGANLFGVLSRRSALAAKVAALLALGLAAAAWAVTLFCGALALAGRPVPELPAVALAVLGIAAGSACLYAIFLLVALKWGRNASIGLGALGFVGAMAPYGRVGERPGDGHVLRRAGRAHGHGRAVRLAVAPGVAAARGVNRRRAGRRRAGSGARLGVGRGGARVPRRDGRDGCRRAGLREPLRRPARRE